MKCSKCGFENEVGNAFCGKCGEKLVKPVKCPKCESEIPTGHKFCGKCGYQLVSIEDFPKSKKLTSTGGIQSKMVCSCGSTDFLSDRVVIGGYNAEKWAKIEIFKYNYVCEKCGAKVYHSHNEDGDYFVFVPKDKAKEARVLSESIGVSEEQSFGRDFCIATLWDDFLANVNFDLSYDYLNHVLNKPTQIVAGYCTKDQNGPELVENIANRTWKECKCGKKVNGNGIILTPIQKSEGYYRTFDFGPASSFAIDSHGKLVVNTNPNIKATPTLPEEFWVPCNKYYRALKAYSNIKDDYISIAPISIEKAVKVLNKIDNPIVFEYVIAIVENTLLGGDLVVIGKKSIWCKSKLSSPRRIVLKKLKSEELQHEKGSMSIKLGDEEMHLKGPSAEAVDKLFDAIRLHWEYLN